MQPTGARPSLLQGASPCHHACPDASVRCQGLPAAESPCRVLGATPRAEHASGCDPPAHPAPACAAAGLHSPPLTTPTPTPTPTPMMQAPSCWRTTSWWRSWRTLTGSASPSAWCTRAAPRQRASSRCAPGLLPSRPASPQSRHVACTPCAMCSVAWGAPWAAEGAEHAGPCGALALGLPAASCAAHVAPRHAPAAHQVPCWPCSPGQSFNPNWPNSN